MRLMIHDIYYDVNVPYIISLYTAFGTLDDTCYKELLQSFETTHLQKTENLTLYWLFETIPITKKQCPPWISSPMSQLIQWLPLIFSRIAPKLSLKSLANLSLLGPFSLLPFIALLVAFSVFCFLFDDFLFLFVMGVTCLMILLCG